MCETDKGFQWQSQSALIIVAAGATVSLNDFLTFPALVSQNGGGAFLIFYILFLFLLGLPLIIGELLLGRISRSDPTHCFETLAARHKASVYWKLIGFLSVIAAVLITSTICVISGWTIAYTVKTAMGVFNSVDIDVSTELFENFLIDSERMAFWHTLFVILLFYAVAQPTKIGMQKLFCGLVPLMLILLIMSLMHVAYTSELTQSIQQFLYADFTAISSDTPLLALQRAFYTLTLGLGVMMAIGRFIPSNISLGYSSALIITVHLLFGLFIGIVVTAYSLSTGSLVSPDSQFAFKLLPVVFSESDFGQIFGTMFYLLLVIAAITTSVALMESPVSYLQRQFNYSRLKATSIIIVIVWLFGMGTVFSYSIWHDDGFTIAVIFGDEAVRLVNNAGFHDVMIFFSSYLLQPVVALFLCFFVAWIIPRELSFKELALPGRHWYESWNYLIRYITPVLIFVVLLKSVGIF